MDGSRILAENEVKRDVTLWLSNDMFDFAKKLSIGDTGSLSIKAVLRSKRQEGEKIVKSVRLVDMRPIKKARV